MTNQQLYSTIAYQVDAEVFAQEHNRLGDNIKLEIAAQLIEEYLSEAKPDYTDQDIDETIRELFHIRSMTLYYDE